MKIFISVVFFIMWVLFSLVLWFTSEGTFFWVAEGIWTLVIVLIGIMVVFGSDDDDGEGGYRGSNNNLLATTTTLLVITTIL